MGLSESQSALFEAANFAYVATVSADGRPQCTPVWVTLIDGKPAFNTAKGRAKHRNIEARPQVSIAVHSPDNPYTYVEVQGTATFTEDGAHDLIDTLSHKYIGQDYPYRQPGEERITCIIEPERVSGM